MQEPPLSQPSLWPLTGTLSDLEGCVSPLHILLNLLSKYLFLPTSQRDVNIGSQILFITSDQSQGQIQNLQQLVFNTQLSRNNMRDSASK